MKRPEWEESKKIQETLSVSFLRVESIMIIDWQIYYTTSSTGSATQIKIMSTLSTSCRFLSLIEETLGNGDRDALSRHFIKCALRSFTSKAFVKAFEIFESLHCIVIRKSNVFMLNTWFLFKWKIERFQFQHLIFIRFLGFTACGMPLCTKHNNFVWPLFLAILDFSNGACSEFRVTYIVACSRMRGNTVYII